MCWVPAVTSALMVHSTWVRRIPKAARGVSASAPPAGVPALTWPGTWSVAGRFGGEGVTWLSVTVVEGGVRFCLQGGWSYGIFEGLWGVCVCVCVCVCVRVCVCVCVEGGVSCFVWMFFVVVVEVVCSVSWRLIILHWRQCWVFSMEGGMGHLVWKGVWTVLFGREFV